MTKLHIATTHVSGPLTSLYTTRLSAATIDIHRRYAPLTHHSLDTTQAFLEKLPAHERSNQWVQTQLFDKQL